MFEYFVYSYGNEIIGLILVTMAGCLGMFVRKILNKWLQVETGRIDSEMKISIARTAAAFVEQVWKNIHGMEKMQKALETAQELLAKKGIPFDADEMMVLIEAAVAEFNEVFKAPLLREDTEGATYDPGLQADDEGNNDVVVCGFAGN